MVAVLADANLEVLQLQEALKVRGRRRRVRRRRVGAVFARETLAVLALGLLLALVDTHGAGRRALRIAGAARGRRMTVA